VLGSAVRKGVSAPPCFLVFLRLGVGMGVVGGKDGGREGQIVWAITRLCITIYTPLIF
jgi:hypothetical protein